MDGSIGKRFGFCCVSLINFWKLLLSGVNGPSPKSLGFCFCNASSSANICSSLISISFIFILWSSTITFVTSLIWFWILPMLESKFICKDWINLCRSNWTAFNWDCKLFEFDKAVFAIWSIVEIWSKKLSVFILFLDWSSSILLSAFLLLSL